MKSKCIAFLLTAIIFQLGCIARDNSGKELASAEIQKPAEGLEQTLVIIKPDAVKNHHIGDIITEIEDSGVRIVGIKMATLSKDEAKEFYSVHKDRPFYSELVDFMSSGPVVAIALEGPNAVAKNRSMIGDTNPKNAEKGTIRAKFGESIAHNAIHGSDTPENAKREILFFFGSENVRASKEAK